MPGWDTLLVGVLCFVCFWVGVHSERRKINTVEELFTSYNTASFQLPLSMESCVEHLRAMWGDIHITEEVRGAIENTYEFIERQLQTLH